jgi:pilus assembly protein CpaB
MAANRYSIVFYSALVIAGGATYGVYRVVETAKAGNRVATVGVVVASVDIPEGTRIDRLALMEAEWPATTVPAGAFAKVDSVSGRVSRVAIFKGEPIVPGRLAPEGTGAGLEVKITPGKRAMGVRINDVSGISGMIQPNSRVDILLVMNSTEGSNDRTAKLFMSNMRILAMGPVVQRGDDGRPIVTTVATLEVQPEESERLAVAQSQGTIQLVLRGYGDPDSIETRGASTRDVVAMLKDYSRAPVSVPARTGRQPVRRNGNGIERLMPSPSNITDPTPQAPRTSAVKPQPPDSFSVKVFRGRAATDQKFQKDTTKHDTTGSGH